MTDEQKSTSSVPVRRVNVTSKKEESSAVVQPDSPVVDKGAGAKRAEILARAREAKRLKKANAASVSGDAKSVTVDTTATSEHNVVDSNMGGNDTDSDSDDLHIVRIPVNVPLSRRKREAVSNVVFGRPEEEDGGEERPRKKRKVSDKASDDGSLRTLVLDKVIDVAKLAAASGVASIGFVLLKGIAGGQLTPQQKTVGGFSSDWVKQ